MADTNPVDNITNVSVDVVGSKLPANNRYGRNGFTGPSSTNPGQTVNTGFLPQVKVPKDNWQTRQVKSDPVQPSFGMKNRSAGVEAIPSKNHRG